MGANDVGIIAVGAYIPRLRISREEIASAHAWLSPAPQNLTQSERSACGFDEDAITMSVEAAIDCLQSEDRSLITDLYFSSTTSPFADRLNAGIVAGALNLSESIRAQDVTGSLRAGTSALGAAFDAARARRATALCVAADRRAAPAGTTQELTTGHGASAFLVGPGSGVARLLGSASLTVDFVDHFRAQNSEFDYHWEERWVRDEGYLKLVPQLVADALAEADVKADEVDHFCMPVSQSRTAVAIAKVAGLAKASIRDNLFAGCGETGVAHPLLMFAQALETARPGEKILVVGFGQGGDALVLEVTEAIIELQKSWTGVSKWLQRRAPLAYFRYITLHGLLQVDRGIRAEVDKPTAMSAAYRHRDFLLGFVGGRCILCDTKQIPKSSICVNPDCGGVGTQVPEPFAEAGGKIASWSADHLTYSPDPPAYYGMIDFDGGGRLLMDFVDIEGVQVDVGLAMRMVFRIKDRDERRGFIRYFWKATPREESEVTDG